MWKRGSRLGELANIIEDIAASIKLDDVEELRLALLDGSNNLHNEARMLAAHLPFKLNREFVERA